MQINQVTIGEMHRDDASKPLTGRMVFFSAFFPLYSCVTEENAHGLIVARRPLMKLIHLLARKAEYIIPQFQPLRLPEQLLPPRSCLWAIAGRKQPREAWWDACHMAQRAFVVMPAASDALQPSHRGDDTLE